MKLIGAVINFRKADGRNFSTFYKWMAAVFNIRTEHKTKKQPLGCTYILSGHHPHMRTIVSKRNDTPRKRSKHANQCSGRAVNFGYVRVGN